MDRGASPRGSSRPPRPRRASVDRLWPRAAGSFCSLPTRPARAAMVSGCGSPRVDHTRAVHSYLAAPRAAHPLRLRATALARSPPTRTCMPPSRAPPRCPAPAGPSPPRSSPGWWPRASAWRRSCSTPAWPRSRQTSRPTPSTSGCPAATAHRVNDTRRKGGRVIAVGTTVVRALESVVDEHGARPRRQRLDRHGGHPRATRCRSVDGLLTGWHEPEASHLAMLEAIAGRPLLERVLRGGARRGLPVARVRRRPPDPPVTTIRSDDCSGGGSTDAADSPLQQLPTTRRAILNLIKRRGRSTPPRWPRPSRITPAAIRQQLARLEEDGLLVHGDEPADSPRRGRPRHVYALTAAAEALYPEALRRPHDRAARLSRRTRHRPRRRPLRTTPSPPRWPMPSPARRTSPSTIRSPS